MDMPTINQKRVPPRGSHSGHGGNQIDKEGGEQRVEAPILPIEHDISGVQSTSPAFPATTDHAAIDGKFAKQSITDERLGEPEQRQASIADARPASPSTMKYSPSSRDSPKSDIQPPSAQVHEVAYDDQKVVSPLRSKEPTSQVQPPSVPSRDADPHGDVSTQQSSIKQWQRASVPLNDMTISSRDAMDMPTINQKRVPPRGSHSGHGGNQIDKEGGEQRVEAPILPIEHDISGVQSTSPAFPATTDHAAIDGKFAKQSITDERLGEPEQTQASIADARPASPSTNRKIPDGVETGGLEQASSSEGQISDTAKATPPGPAIIHEDSHDAAIDKKATKHGSNGDQLITGPVQEHAHPPAPTHGAMEPIGSRRTSKEPQLHGSSQAEVVDAERKSIMSDKKPARAAQPLSPVEPVNIDNNVYGAYDSIAPQMTFRQQARPLAPITKAVPASEFQSVKRKIQEVTPDYHHIEDSGKPLVPSQEDQISHASQAIPPQEDLKYSPSSTDSPKSDIQPPLVQDHEVAHDDQKLVPPLRSKKPTYQGQPPSEPSQDAAPPEDLSNKLSTVEQWQRASVPLANQMAKESGEQRKETPILPIESETSGVQSTSPSFPEAVTTHHAIIDDKFAKQSNIDERLGERKQMQAPITDSPPTSPPIKRKAPDGPETGDLVPAGSSQGQSDAAKVTPPGPATIREDYHDAATDEKTTKYDARGDQLVTGPLHEQARPHAPTHEAKDPIGGRRTSKEPQLRGSSQDEVAHAEQKSILSDQKAARSAQPLSPDMKYSPSARDFPKSDIKPSSAQIHEVSRDESSEQQGSHVESAFRPNELGSTEKKFIPSGHSADEPSSAAPWNEDLVAPIAKQIKALPGVTGQRGTPETREFPTSEDALDDISTNVDVHPTASTKAPRRSFSVEPTSSAQASPFHVAHDSLHTGTTPDDALGNAVSMKPPATPDDQHGITPGNTTDEVAPAEHKFVPSGPDSVHSKRSPLSMVHRNEVTGDSTPETQQIFSMMQRKGDIAAPDQAKGTRKTLDQEDMMSAPLRSVSPSLDTQRPSEKAQEHIPADDVKAISKPPSDIREVRQSTVVPASAPAAQHGAATDEEVLDKMKFVPSGQDSVRSTLPLSALEQRNGRIGDSSTKPKKGDIASTPDQAKDSEITLRGQDILPPARSVSPSSDIQRPSGKVHDVPTNDLGEAKPIVKASAPDTQYVDAQDEAAPDEKKFAPPDILYQSCHQYGCLLYIVSCKEPTSSNEPRKEEIRNSAPSKQLIFSTEKIKENATIGTPDQGKGLQTTLDQQDIPSEPVKLPSPPSDTHHQSKKAREDAPADDLGETTLEPSALDREVRPSTVVPRSAPVTQYGAARDEALDKQKSIPSGQDSVHSALLRNGEIGDPAPSTQQIGDAAASIPKQATDAQITPSRQDILPPVRLESPSSDIQRPLGKVHEDAPADDVREAEPILQASARDTQDKNIVPSEPTSSTKSRNKDIRDSAPSAQVISSTGTTNEDAIIAAPDQDKDLQTTLDQEDILSAPVRSASPSSDTQHPSEKSPEDVLGNDFRETALKPLASGPVRLPGAGPDEIAHDEQKIVPSGSEVPFSQDSVQSVQPSFSSEQIKEDSIVTSADQTEDSQTIMYRRNVTPSVDTSKTPLPGEEQVPLGPDEEHATEPYRTAVDEKITISPSSKAYNSESGSNLTQARTDVHPSIGERPTETSFPGHGLQTQPPLATQDISLGSSNKAKSAGEEAKEPIASAPETQPDSTQPQDEAASAEQNFAISGNQDTRQRPDAREALSKSQESPRDDDGISNLVDPLVRQEQASRAERASEGPVSEMQSANADEKTTLPSSQAQTSNTGPDSTLATGDAYLTSADMPATNSLQNQEAQPLAATQAPITQAPPASSQNVHHADSLENTETPIQPSRAPPAPVTSSAAYSDTLNGEPGTATFQTPQGASFDLLGGEKTTTTQGDQVNPLLNGDLSTSQPVRPSESAGFKGTNTLQKLEGSSANEKSKAQHQTDRSEILSSKDNNKEANKAIRSDLRPKENMKSTREFEHQEQADQAIVQSPDGNRKQIEQTKTHDTETGELEEMDPQENANQTNNKVSPVGALDSSGKQAPGVQLQGENIKYTSNSADNVPGDIQTRSNSEDNLTSYEGAKVQQQPEGNTVDGETGAPLSGTVQQNGRDLPENSYQNNNSQSQAEASDKSAGKFSPGIQNKNKSSSGLDSPTDGTKSGDAEDKSG
ncbi:hypothetical protein PR202_ga16515 [Eleusine coracana subsp. coracana]|uniref:Uncharacterized protein n=1 Tax=Eleusine coracana subsp. coracana TaxID=191504 RepID=A0AAV5CMT0_ELECO|nr:hypothetical protein PR202_ga16515 [Eleusine coracana subsp. coracana]